MVLKCQSTRWHSCFDLTPWSQRNLAVDLRKKKRLALTLRSGLSRLLFRYPHVTWKIKESTLVDWLATGKSGKKMDPLWLLNHYHYLDNCPVTGQAGLILSRYGGPGNTGIDRFSRIPLWLQESSLSALFCPAQLQISGWLYVGGVTICQMTIWGYYSELALRWLQFGVASWSIVSIVLVMLLTAKGAVVYSSKDFHAGWSDIYACVTAYYLILHHECGDAWTRTALVFIYS